MTQLLAHCCSSAAPQFTFSADTPLTFCGIFGSPENDLHVVSVCTIIIINSACFLSLVSFWPKIIVRHARSHTHTHTERYRTAPEVSFTSAKANLKGQRGREGGTADRQPSRLLSAIYRVLYGHHASQGTRQLLQIQLNMCADCTLYIVLFWSVWVSL